MAEPFTIPIAGAGGIRFTQGSQGSQVAQRQSYNTVFTGQDTVPNPGTEVALNGDVSTDVGDGVTVKAFQSNTDAIYVGDGSVGSADGFILGPGEEVEINVDDVSNIYIDAAIADDGVSWKLEKSIGSPV